MNDCSLVLPVALAKLLIANRLCFPGCCRSLHATTRSRDGRSLFSPRTGRSGTAKSPSQILCITRTCRSCRRWELSNINETINIMTAAPKIAPHQTPWINPEPSIISPRPPSLFNTAHECKQAAKQEQTAITSCERDRLFLE